LFGENVVEIGLEVAAEFPFGIVVGGFYKHFSHTLGYHMVLAIEH